MIPIESLYQIWYELTSEIEDGIIILNDSDIICHLNKGIFQLFPVNDVDYIGKKRHDVAIRLDLWKTVKVPSFTN